MPSEHVGRWKLSVEHLDRWLKALLLKNPATEPASSVMRYCVLAHMLTSGWELRGWAGGRQHRFGSDAKWSEVN